MSDTDAIDGTEGAYVPCNEAAAALPASTDDSDAISGHETGYVPIDELAAGLPADDDDDQAISGHAVGFVARPCACTIDSFRRTVSPTSVTLASSTGALIGPSDLGPNWDMFLLSDRDLVRVEVDGTAWVTTLSIATNGFEGHAQGKVSASVANALSSKLMRFTLRALPGSGDYCARVIFNPVGRSVTGPGGFFGGGVSLGSGLGGFGGSVYVTINPHAAGSSFVQNRSEIGFTASVWDVLTYYAIAVPTAIPYTFWVAGAEYTVLVTSVLGLDGEIHTTATISSSLGGSYSVSIALPPNSGLPEYDAPTLTGPEVAILRSFSFGSPNPWVIAVECVDIPEYA